MIIPGTLVEHLPLREEVRRRLDVWERISCPVLILRGENSTFFPQEIAEKMLACGPEAELVELPGSGHAPTLRSAEQVDVIANWLAQV